MTRLTISLLGPLRVFRAGDPITVFGSDKVRALLAYLAVEADHPHRRESLAGTFWPERSARHNLSQALLGLRNAIGDRDATPPFLLVTRQTVQFNRDSDHSLDATAFAALLADCEEHRHDEMETCDRCMDRLQQAAELYQGSFLEGFSVGDSPAFEEWVVLQRERLHRLAIDALQRLTGFHERRGELEQALRHAWRQVELDSWQEKAHRQLMRLLALSGRRNAALAQYQACRRVLADELGVEPTRQTTELFEQIRDGKYERPELPRQSESTKIRGSSKSQPFRLWALVTIFILLLVLSFGLLAGFLKPGSNQTAVDPSTDQTDIPQAEYRALVTLYEEEPN